MRSTVVVEDRGGHDGAANGGHFGNWAQIFASRPEIATVEVVEENHFNRPGQISEHHDKIVVEVTVNEASLQPGDFVLVFHRRSWHPGLNGDSRREWYELLAGTMPAWANFPAAWREWTLDHRVSESAADHIIRLKPELEKEVRYAQRKTAKGTMYDAWITVSQSAGLEPGLFKGSRLNFGSWSAVRAMPMRIAQRLGGNWRPPVPRPEYEAKPSNLLKIAGPEK